MLNVGGSSMATQPVPKTKSITPCSSKVGNALQPRKTMIKTSKTTDEYAAAVEIPKKTLSSMVVGLTRSVRLTGASVGVWAMPRY
jgi:hypothetical protein